MVMRLGETSDPLDLIPGNPASIAEVAGKMYGYSTVLDRGRQRPETHRHHRRLERRSG